MCQAKSIALTIEDLIGVFMWSCCKSTTTIKRVVVESVTYWDLCKEANHVVGFVQRSQSHIGIHAKEKASTRSSPIED